MTAGDEPRLSEWCAVGVVYAWTTTDDGEITNATGNGHSWCGQEGGCGCPCHAEADDEF